MRIAESLVPEFDQEMAGVRKTLERLPENQWEWQPHKKSMKMGKLSNHIVDIPGWVTFTFDRDTLDVGEFQTPSLATREELLASFDKNVAQGRAILADISDDAAHSNWSMTAHGQTFFTMPKIEVIRTWVLNHIIHHRAQLGVYLRLLDIPVPGMYGPSADEM